MMPLINAARAHIEYMVLDAFIEQAAFIEDAHIRLVVNRMRSIFALTAIENPQAYNALAFVEDGYLSQTQVRDVRAQVNDLLAALLPEAIGLTDSWNFTDASLCSALGMRDGNVYETLMKWTRQIPLNTDTARTAGSFKEGFDKFVEPFFKARL